ncbi:MAG: hypothetical protein WDN69_17360 [Aliidongia sp.]
MPAPARPALAPPSVSVPLLDRPALLNRLDGASAQVTLLLAPAGYGKDDPGDAMARGAARPKRAGRLARPPPARGRPEPLVHGLVQGFAESGLPPLQLAGYAPVVLACCSTGSTAAASTGP